MENKYLKLFANCILVKGASRVALCDIHRGQVETLPLSIAEVFDCLETNTIQKTIEIYGQENKEVLMEYISFVLVNEYAFLCDEVDKDNFPKLSLDFDYPSVISNAIIDIKESFYETNFTSIFEQLEQLCCNYIQMRFYKIIPLEEISKCIEQLKETTIIGIDLILQYDETCSDNDYLQLAEDNLRITSLSIVNSPVEKNIFSEGYQKDVARFYEIKLDDASCCGAINKDYFTMNTQLFTESQKFNTCLNKKISIDINGEIKNCPSMLVSYGNIKDTTLQEALNKEKFKEAWTINKDQIEICKDCEFRHVCTDCRAYITDKNNKLSKPSKCNYNPYTATWENE